MVGEPLLRKVDAVTVRVPSLDAGIAFDGSVSGYRALWRNDEAGQVGLAVSDSETEIVLATGLAYEPNWLVDSADAAAEVFALRGGRVVVPAFDIAVGRVAVVEDPFGNRLVLIDLSKGRYPIADPPSTGSEASS